MNKASPVDMRKALEAVDVLKKAGILFIPVPVLGDDDYLSLVDIAAKRLQVLFNSASTTKKDKEKP